MYLHIENEISRLMISNVIAVAKQERQTYATITTTSSSRAPHQTAFFFEGSVKQHKRHGTFIMKI